MKLKRCLHNSDSGFTILELLVASTIGMLLTALTIGTTLANRNLFQNDLVRTRLNQNLRGALDVLGVNIREAGENLSSVFPAISITNGANGAADTLVLRRNLVNEILKVCTAIVQGTTVTRVYFATVGVTPGCTYSSNVYSYNSWRTYRIGEGGTVRGYIYDQTAKAGEFFDYTSETNSGTELYLQTPSHTWAHAYPVASSSVYLIEQWDFHLDPQADGSSILQVIENADDNNALNILYGITNFQIKIIKPDDTQQDVLLSTDKWTDIKSVQVTLTGQEQGLHDLTTRTLQSRFFPRNILSN